MNFLSTRQVKLVIKFFELVKKVTDKMTEDLLNAQNTGNEGLGQILHVLAPKVYKIKRQQIRDMISKQQKD